jgi:hypothetical protein
MREKASVAQSLRNETALRQDARAASIADAEQVQSDPGTVRSPLAALIGSSPVLVAQRRLVELIAQSPRLAAQRKVVEGIDHSARHVPQLARSRGLPARECERNAAGVVQRVPLEVAVTGITHLVIAAQGSIMAGDQEIEVTEGQIVEIDTGQKLRSRRGPNQELHGAFDPEGTHDYRWFRVLSVDGGRVPPNTYLRDDTFHTFDPGALGKRPAIIKGHGRSRLAPEDANAHAIATRIVSNAVNVPEAEYVHGVVTAWMSGGAVSELEPGGAPKRVHDPLKTLRFIRIAYAFSVDPTVRRLVQEDRRGEVKAVADMLYAVAGRQLFQEWSADLAGDVTSRGAAWMTLIEGVRALELKPALDRYLYGVLEHDKGYAQALESAARYLFLIDEGPVAPEAFGVVVERMLRRHLNTNVWTGGQAASGAIGAQLTRAEMPSVAAKLTAGAQQDNMWDAILIALINAKNEDNPDWSYIQTIQANRAELLVTVQGIVPASFALGTTSLEAAIKRLTDSF